MKALTLPHGSVPLPAFFPDGTRGVVRCVDSADLEGAGVPGIVMNTYHLMTKPGAATIRALGGLHSFCNWQRPIITDSGGFQVFSLLRENPSFGEIRRDGIIFRREGKKVLLSPEKCIQSQLAYGSDVLMALDYCTHPADPYEKQALAVETTIRWGRQSMKAFGKHNSPRQLFGIIQGGDEKSLRKECADALIQQGFSGFGFGGWPLDAKGRLTEDILAYTASLMPGDKIKYAMGIGRPENIVACVAMGYTLFDCVIPTREARHHRLYVFNPEFEKPGQIDLSRPFYKFHYILDDIHRRDKRPVSPLCDCHACTHYSRAYLRHLISIGDSLGSRLATIHNLRFYTMLMELLRYV
ncbi:MAG: tRNA guanosine(34) transglycosylase Tgt [Defluviitaleaceae bacterium]|nr:tRNA guanosine(34) transglycosylase Tgt [Defluviitaleaceae bacterium]MCL2240158.1 tRNA guanosine(34) transglycosylase Tgt [Defluviitaleaceae bacterium]